MKGLRWEVAPPQFKVQGEFADRLGIHPLVGQLLANRGIDTIEEATEFLDPSMQRLISPDKMHDMTKAAARICKAIKNHERIAIFGDYDVDGVTSTATMYHALSYWKTEPRLYIPHRINEGYGINDRAIRQLADEGCTLIVSVDCGITAVEPAKVAKDCGVDLIVTDHHEWKETLPDCYATVHPRLDDGYPNRDLCGAGVAFKLAWAIGSCMAQGDRVEAGYALLLKELLAFTALGTIADVVPLIGENRVIAIHGLAALPRTRFIGLNALIESARFGESIDGNQVGFTLAPRLNAAGRMGHAHDALKMLTYADRALARDIAQELEGKNRWRQDTQKKIVSEAKEIAAKYEGDPALICVGKKWHAGVVGIVASRLIDDHYCPTLVLTDSNGKAHGSARSVEGFDLAKALKHCESLLTRWGGHAMAAGLELPTEKVPEFRKMLCDYVAAHCPPELRKRKLDVDCYVDFRELDVDVVRQIKAIGPFGSHNRKPLLAAKDVIIHNPKTMGNEGKHLRFEARQGERVARCIAWGQGEQAHQLPTDTAVEIAFEPELNEWQGNTSVQLLCRDVRIPVAL